MKRELVQSSSLASVGYNHDFQMLEIEFVHGGIYRYYKVPVSVYEALMNAPSKGSYYHDHVRDAGYDYEKVGE